MNRTTRTKGERRRRQPRGRALTYKRGRRLGGCFFFTSLRVLRPSHHSLEQFIDKNDNLCQNEFSLFSLSFLLTPSSVYAFHSNQLLSLPFCFNDRTCFSSMASFILTPSSRPYVSYRMLYFLLLLSSLLKGPYTKKNIITYARGFLRSPIFTFVRFFLTIFSAFSPMTGLFKCEGLLFQ
jgi:hypothetical protein